MFKVKLTILLINFLVVSTICDDSIIVPVAKENNENEKVCEEPLAVPDYILVQAEFFELIAECINQVINMTHFKDELGEAETEENVNEIVKSACLKNDIIYECVEKEFNGLLDECTPVEVRENKDELLQQSRNFLNHLCFDDGLRLRNFYNDDGISCAIEKDALLTNCTRNISGHLRSNESFAEKCNYLKSTRVCLVEALQTCEKQGAAIFFDELLHLVFDEHIMCKVIVEPVV